MEPILDVRIQKNGAVEQVSCSDMYGVTRLGVQVPVVGQDTKWLVYNVAKEDDGLSGHDLVAAPK